MNYNSFNVVMISSFFNRDLHSWFRLQHPLLASSMRGLESEICPRRYRQVLLAPHDGLDDERMMRSLQSWGGRVRVEHQVLQLTVLAQGGRGSRQQRLAFAGLLQFD